MCINISPNAWNVFTGKNHKEILILEFDDIMVKTIYWRNIVKWMVQSVYLCGIINNNSLKKYILNKCKKTELKKLTMFN